MAKALSSGAEAMFAHRENRHRHAARLYEHVDEVAHEVAGRP
jgi:hypothetical protein